MDNISEKLTIGGKEGLRSKHAFNFDNELDVDSSNVCVCGNRENC